MSLQLRVCTKLFKEMSKKKHNVAYIKQDEPKFLKLMKQEIGYKEGPTVETKRQRLDFDSDSEDEEHEAEKPVVVVLKDGDMTAEEAEAFQKKKGEEEANTPADLSKKIVFNKPKSKKEINPEKPDVTVNKSSKKKKKTKMLLSFDAEDEEET